MAYQIVSCVASIVYNTDWKILALKSTLRFGLFLKYELYVYFICLLKYWKAEAVQITKLWSYDFCCLLSTLKRKGHHNVPCFSDRPSEEYMYVY